MPRILKWLFLFTVLAAIGQAWWLNDHLPPRIASHFGFQGRADGWMGRDEFFLFQSSSIVFLGLVFGGLGRLIRLVPTELINVPHRDYWLASERREASLAWVGAMGHAMGIGTLGFLGLVFHQVYLANVSGSLQLPVLPLILGPLIIVTGVITAVYIRFKRPANHTSRQHR